MREPTTRALPSVFPTLAQGVVLANLVKRGASDVVAIQDEYEHATGLSITQRTASALGDRLVAKGFAKIVTETPELRARLAPNRRVSRMRRLYVATDLGRDIMEQVREVLS